MQIVPTAYQTSAIDSIESKALVAAFEARFGRSDEPILCGRAPARVNLIGDHIDYNGGFVLPCAINRYLYVLARKKKGRTASYYSAELDAAFECSLDEAFTYKSDLGFANYINGCLAGLQKHGAVFDSGFELFITSTIPVGSALSSSAALEVAFILTAATLFGAAISRTETALLGKWVENEFLGLQSGIMDQFIIANAKAHTAMLLDTSSLRCEYIPLDLNGQDSQGGAAYSLVVMNSNKPRSLVGSKYNERKRECEKALAILQRKFSVKTLCELVPADIPSVEDFLKAQCSDTTEATVLFRRVRHCITENSLVQKAVSVLRKKDVKALGVFLTESHASLKNDYETSGRELDSLVANALTVKGCIGARMTGAGFSGCAIAIVETSELERFKKTVAENYRKECNLRADFYVCDSVDAASVGTLKNV